MGCGVRRTSSPRCNRRNGETSAAHQARESVKFDNFEPPVRARAAFIRAGT
jgi:hypothetical protein